MKRKPRKYATSEHAKQDRELKASWEKLLKAHPPGTVKIAKPKQLVPEKSALVLPNTRLELSKAPSKGVVDHIKRAAPKRKMTVEMLEREKAAQEEIERKKKMVAPAYNKGGLQYISNPDDYKSMGRKV